MDSIIRELIGIDRIANEHLDSAYKLRDEKQSSLSKQKTAIQEEITAKYEAQFQACLSAAESEKTSKIAELETEYNAALCGIEKHFDEQRSDWADALFKRITEC